MKYSDAPPTVGGSSLLVIFAVLSLTIFAVLGLSTVQADGRISTAAADSIRAYYEADCAAEEILAQLREGMMPPGVVKNGDIFIYECVISETQKLVVEVEVKNEKYEILRWQMDSTREWVEDDRLQLWDGNLE